MDYIKNRKYFAQVAGSLEKLAATELEGLGAVVSREVPRGLYFGCSQEILYRVVYESRIVQRVLAPIINYQCHSEKYLYDQARKNVDWPALFRLEDKFAIEANVSDSSIQHSLYASQILKDAICDSFRERFDARPDFSSKEPDVIFSLYIHNNWATISLDVSGGSMHKRGYRIQRGEAPLQETLAAGLIALSGWDGETPLYDPMCGSGTILAEAMMRYCRIPAGYLREDTGISYLPDFDPKLWEQVKEKANAGMRRLPQGLIQGSDISADNIEIARDNLSRLPQGSMVMLQQARFQKLGPKPEHTIITNPPYGVRLGDDAGTIQLYNEFGDWLRHNCPSSTAYVLCGSEALVSELKLRNRWKKKLMNSDLETYYTKILIK